MLAASLLAIFFIPVSFDVVERFGIWIAAARKRNLSQAWRRLPLRRKEEHMTKPKQFAVVLLLLSLSACKVGPNYKRPPLTVPDQYRGLAPDASTADQPSRSRRPETSSQR